MEQYQAIFEMSDKQPVVKVFSANVVAQKQQRENKKRGNENYVHEQQNSHVNYVNNIIFFSCGSLQLKLSGAA